jgi:hypothetical protein
VGPSPLRSRALPRPLSLWQGDARRRRASPEGGDHRLEPVRGGRSRQLEPALRRPRVSTHEPRRARRGRGLLVERPQLHGGGEGGEGRARRPRRLRPLGRRHEGEAVGGGRLLREDGRARGPGEPRLVPGRLVRRPDPRLEGRRGRRLLRPATGLRGDARARSHGVRAVLPRAWRHPGDLRPALVVRGTESTPGRRRPRGRRARGGAPLSSLVRETLCGDRGGGGVVADELRLPAREDGPLLGLLPRPDLPARGRRGGGRQTSRS